MNITDLLDDQVEEIEEAEGDKEDATRASENVSAGDGAEGVADVVM